MRVAITRESGTPEGVVNRVNGLMGKMIQSPRDDFPGTVEVFDIVSLQVIKTGANNWYGIAVVEIGVRNEHLDLEKAFFDGAAKET